MPSTKIPNTQALIDSRDVIARIDELQDIDDRDDDERDELDELIDLQEEGKDCADWQHGETLICDSYFKEYAQDLADELGLTNDNAGWPYTCIDWDQAARELQYDYSMIDFGDVTYWVRS